MQERRKFQVVVVGGGPGGYVAAIMAAELGQRVALIEDKYLGGTCLNVGCIPTKTLLAGADIYHKVKNAHHFGISCEKISFDFGKMKGRKDEIVTKLRKSLEGLILAYKVTLIPGFGQLLSEGQVKVTGTTNEIIEGDRIILATGSKPKRIEAFPFDYDKIHDSTSILELTILPKKIVIVGGGVIGCEFASLFSEFGVKVVILEALSSLLPFEAKNVSSALTSAFLKRGILIETSVFVEKIESSSSGVKVHLQGDKMIEGDLALVAVGRSLNTEGIGLEKVGVLVEKGAVVVDERMQTEVPTIFAVGDMTGKALLAHVASHQGIVAAKNASGHEAKMRYEVVPNVIFTHPEVATVGLSEERAKANGYRVTIGKYPFQALGKSIATNQTEGSVSLVVDSETEAILGAQAVGFEASSLIAPMALAIQNELTLESITETIHAHPTIAESWLEAALIAAKTPIHFPPSSKT